MKPLKFRVWDKDLTQYNSPNVHHIVKTNKTVCVVLNSDIQKICEDGRFVIQQYTGLNDKHGVEIYEGDIVRGKFFDTDYLDDVLVTCSVNWVEESACFNVGNRFWTRSSLKVVGNIFENPELLEE